MVRRGEGGGHGSFFGRFLVMKGGGLVESAPLPPERGLRPRDIDKCWVNAVWAQIHTRDYIDYR